MKKVSLLSLIVLMCGLYSCNFKSNHSSESTCKKMMVPVYKKYLLR